jgi:N-acetylglucosamine-6-phosphate deacetylase
LTSKLIHSTTIFQDGALEENAWALLTQDQTITGVGDGWKSHSADEVIDGTGKLLHAGLFDTHCHGAAGFAANRGLDEIKRILDLNEKNQVTRSLISLVSADVADMVEIAVAVQALAEDPRFVGLHFEGPFLSHDHKGAQDPNVLKKPTDEELKQIIAARTVASMTLAPELFNAHQLTMLHDAGIKLCFGHSAGDYSQALEFFNEHEHSVMTHTFNGMKGIHHREPGPIPAAIETDTFMELIADGIHVSAAAARLIPAVRLILVTDAIDATGQPDGDYFLGAVPITVSGGAARTHEGCLAGSTLLLKDAVKNYAGWTANPLAAIRAATTNPELAYGIEPSRLALGSAFLLDL